MKIAYFVENYKRGGVDTFIKNLTSKKISNDIFYLIYNKNNPGINYIKKKSVNIRYLHYSIFSWDKLFNKKMNYISLFICKTIYSILFPLTFCYQIFRLVVFFKKNNFDKLMVINGGYPGGDICLAATIAWLQINPKNKPWINFHNFALKKYKFFLLDFYKNQIDKIISSSIMGFISVSKICTLSIKSRKYLKKNKLFTIYNGHYFDRNNKKYSIKKNFDLPQNSKILLMLAEYDLRKGHEYIIKAMEKIIASKKNVFLFIYGYGDKSLIEGLVLKSPSNKNIFLNDFEENSASLISGCDLMVIPSQQYESFGYTAIEAMSLKKVVVATNSGGLPEVIDDKSTGYLVSKNKPNLFAKKILYLLDNSTTLKKMANKSYLTYKKRFTNVQMIKNYNNLIKHNRIK
ncbi:glycosyltransferase family 4 protein [Candidatus Pelagibacter sp. Uisw_127]|uniref:glycosyltransferase family 4 protein n=1 Tax=Candidatus Pelagibacter sp. Uisw_127 TaxID=3230988 RepID=UPI0039EB3673